MKQIFSLLCTLAICAMIAVSCSDDNEEAAKKTFTVTFNTQGGSAVSAQTVKDGDKVTEPEAPTKAGVIFGGWYTSADYAKAWDFSKDVVTEDVTLYAKWASESVIVSFETNGGNEIAEQKVAKGGLLANVPVPVKTGSAFDGWYTNKELTTEFNANTPIENDIKLYAKWTTISKESLQKLIEQADPFISSNYTQESYNKMIQKLDAAKAIVSKADATKEEIETAYEELSKAIKGLIPLRKRETTALHIAPTPINDIIYINPTVYYEEYTKADEDEGYYRTDILGITAWGVDSSGNFSSNSKVIFSYNGLNDWATNVEESGDEWESYLYFKPKEDLETGKEITITIKSADNTAISKTITLKVITSSEAKTKYISLMESLPETSAINFDNFEEVNEKYEAACYHIYNNMKLADKKSTEVTTLRAKEDKYDNALDCIWKASYQFEGNTCIIAEGEADYYEFTPNGAFPAGTYTQKETDNMNYQEKIVLNADKTINWMERYRNDQNSNWGEWKPDSNGLYKIEGDNKEGVIYFQITEEFDATTTNLQARKSKIKTRRK